MHVRGWREQVTFNGSKKATKKPWQATSDEQRSLGMYETPKEAAAAYSRWLGRDVAASLAAAVEREAAPMSSEEALRLAEREGLTLEARKPSRTGGGAAGRSANPYRGVFVMGTGPRRFLARFKQGGQTFTVGCYQNAELAALEIARARAKLKLA